MSLEKEVNWNKWEKVLQEKINNNMVIAGLRAEFPSEAGLHPGAAAWHVSCTWSFTPLPITEYSHPDIGTCPAAVGEQRGQKHGENWPNNLIDSRQLLGMSGGKHTLLEVHLQQRDGRKCGIYKGFGCLQEFLLFTLDQIIFTVWNHEVTESLNDLGWKRYQRSLSPTFDWLHL